MFAQLKKYKRYNSTRGCVRKEKYTKGAIGGLYSKENKHSCCVAATQPRNKK